MRELNAEEMDQVTGGSSVTGMVSIRPLGNQSDATMVVARTHLATIQSELDALNINEQIWSSLSGS